MFVQKMGVVPKINLSKITSKSFTIVGENFVINLSQIAKIDIVLWIYELTILASKDLWSKPFCDNPHKSNISL